MMAIIAGRVIDLTSKGSAAAVANTTRRNELSRSAEGMWFCGLDGRRGRAF
jgi:hypothetical protein